MRIVQERKQERHGDRLQSSRADRIDEPRQFILGERRHHLALRVDPFGDLEAPAPRHQHRRRVLQQVVQVGARGTSQFQDVTHATRRDKAGACPLVLEQRVGDHGGGMRQQCHIGGLDMVGIQTLANALDHRLAKILRRGRQLDDGDATRLLLHQGDVGEGAADIDADPPGHAVGSRFMEATTSGVMPEHRPDSGSSPAPRFSGRCGSSPSSAHDDNLRRTARSKRYET